MLCNTREKIVSFVCQRKEGIGHVASNQGCPHSPLQASKLPSTHLVASRSRTDHCTPPTDRYAWTKETSMLSPVWTRLPPIPEACLQLVTCGCKSKCKTVWCTCYKKELRCTPACGYDAVECCNPAGQ